MARIVIAGAGHRPDKLGGFDFYNEKELERLTYLAFATIKRYEPKKSFSEWPWGGIRDWRLGQYELPFS